MWKFVFIKRKKKNGCVFKSMLVLYTQKLLSYKLNRSFICSVACTLGTYCGWKFRQSIGSVCICLHHARLCVIHGNNISMYGNREKCVFENGNAARLYVVFGRVGWFAFFGVEEISKLCIKDKEGQCTVRANGTKRDTSSLIGWSVLSACVCVCSMWIASLSTHGDDGKAWKIQFRICGLLMLLFPLFCQCVLCIVNGITVNKYGDDCSDTKY